MSKQIRPTQIFSDSECLSVNQINDYLHDRLSTKERHAVEKHMLDCSLCEEAVEGYSLMAENEAGAAIPEIMIEGFHRPFVKWLAASVAAIVVLGAGLFYLNRNLSTREFGVAEKQSKKLQVVGALKKNDSIVLEQKKSEIAIQSPKEIEKRKEPPTPEKYKEISPSPEFNSDGRIFNPAVAKQVEEPVKASSGQLSEVEMDTLILKSNERMDYYKQATIINDSENLKKGKSAKIQKVSTRKKVDNRADGAGLNDEASSDEKSMDKDERIYIMRKGIDLFGQGKYEEAALELEGVLTGEPQNAEALYFAGKSYQEMKNYEKAISLWEKITNGMSYYQEARWERACALIENKKKEEAQKLLKQISSEDGPFKDKAIKKLEGLN